MIGYSKTGAGVMHPISTVPERIATPEDSIVTTDKHSRVVEQGRIQIHHKLNWNPDYI